MQALASHLAAIAVLFTFASLATPTHAATVQKGLVILVEFPDVTHGVTRAMAQTRFSRQLTNYAREVSYGKLALQFDVTQRWYRLPNPVGRYKISPRNLEVDRSRVRALIEDALAAADSDVDLSQYAFAAIFLGATVQDYGMIGLCGYPGMLGWSSTDVLRTKSGRAVKGGVAIFCYQAHVGTLFHDVAHILGGVKDGKRVVPCLYDHDLQARPGPMRETAIGAMINLGYWDPMSCHYIAFGQPPPAPCSWTRLRLSWIDPAKIKIVKPRERAEVVLGPLEDGASQVLVVKIPISQTRYYLLENRQPIGCDRVLPGKGVLILLADDSVAECRQGKAPVKLINANPSVPNLEGAAFDIGGRDSFVDEKNGIRIQLTEKVGSSYRIAIGAP